MRRLSWLTLLLAMVLPARGHAQSTTAAVTHRSPRQSADRVALAAVDSARGPNFGLRFLAGIGGAAVGVVAGAFAGPAIFGTDCGGCDDPGLGQALVGAAVGTVAGAAVAAALPQLKSRCGFGGRFGRALIGATIGGGIGVLVSGGSAVIIGSLPIGAAGGGAVGAGAC